MALTQIDIDQDALDRAMDLSKAKTEEEAVNLALRYHADKRERAARVARHFERARDWETAKVAERLHRAERNAGDPPAQYL